MKTMMMPVEMYGEMEDQTMMTSAMDVDDVDSFDLFEQGGGGGPLDHCRLADDGFFNTFSDDFDDTDINLFRKEKISEEASLKVFKSDAMKEVFRIWEVAD
ncbi:hypothetical protein Tco_0945689 [Tanacetum coccineum]